MPQDPIVTPGDDIALVQDLYEDGLLVNLTGATILAALQDSNGRQLISVATQSSAAAGASWSTGRVVCEFPRATSLMLRPGYAFLEIEVIRSGKRVTWPLISVNVQAGSIP